MFKYFIVSCMLAMTFVLQSKFSDFAAMEIDVLVREIADYEREISALKREIHSAANVAEVRAFARERNWDFVNLKNEQIVLLYNERNNTYRVQNERRNIVEQIMLSFTE